MASRILGMGDVVSLIERAEAELDEEKAKELERQAPQGRVHARRPARPAQADPQDGLAGLALGMLPGVGKQLRGMNVDERQLDRVEAIILSMTPDERRQPGG